MEKLFLILDNNNYILGSFESNDPENMIVPMTPENGSIVSIANTNDNSESLMGGVFSITNSTEVVEDSIPNCVHYTNEQIAVKPDRSLFWEYVNDEWVDGRALIELQNIAKLKIDNYAGVIRSKYITVAPGQEMTYMEKSEEAADFVTAGYPADTSNYPFVQAEMDATGITKEQAADSILAQKSAWIAVGSAIERHRLSGKAQVDAASNASEVDTAVVDAIALLDAV